MILLWFTAGVVPAVLLGVYLPWSAWVLPVGLGSLAAGFLFKGLKKWPPLRRFLFGAGAILVWLAVYSALFHAPAQDLAGASAGAYYCGPHGGSDESERHLCHRS